MATKHKPCPDLAERNKHACWQFADEIVDLRKQGLSYKRIADKYGCSEKPITNIIKDYKSKHKDFDPPVSKVKHPAYEESAKIVDMYINEGLSHREIAERFGVGNALISKILKKAGVKTRQNSDGTEITPRKPKPVKPKPAKPKKPARIAQDARKTPNPTHNPNKSIELPQVATDISFFKGIDDLKTGILVQVSDGSIKFRSYHEVAKEMVQDIFDRI